VIGGLLGRTSLGLFFQILFNKTQFQSVKSPLAQFRCRRTANVASICALATDRALQVAQRLAQIDPAFSTIFFETSSAAARRSANHRST